MMNNNNDNQEEEEEGSSPFLLSTTVPSHNNNTTSNNNSNGNNDIQKPHISQRIKDKIIDTVDRNRVTIIVGPTGSGKSTQVPQLLLNNSHHHRQQYNQNNNDSSSNNNNNCKKGILCTQPRRLAVVAIAKRVAEECNVPLGGHKVGYHVGNHNLSLKTTQLLFTTAGILLEEIKARGIDALTRFSTIVIDECHERSPESDLILTLIRECIRTYPKETFRIILMSATFDKEKYKSYFLEGGASSSCCEYIDTITLETAQSFNSWNNMVQTFYLDDLPTLLPPHVYNNNPAIKRYIRNMKSNAMDDIDNIDIGGNRKNCNSLSESLLLVIRSLVSWIDITDSDEEEEQEQQKSPIIIFAPTYRHLEQLYDTLYSVNDHSLSLSVLHSSVDIEDCIRAMFTDDEISNDNNKYHQHQHHEQQHHNKRTTRKVLLASAIADSSITVPGVRYVIDTCRSLEVKWKLSKKCHVAKTVWASQSICDQRAGRTGRTCTGTVFRLVPKRFYISDLKSFDKPQLALSSCYNELLAMVSTSSKHSKIISSSGGGGDATKLFQNCIDPPSKDVVNHAAEHLVSIGACKRGEETSTIASLIAGRQRNHHDENQHLLPTPYGSLLAAFPINISAARMIVSGARLGLLHETLVLMAIMNHKPSPLVHLFGNSQSNEDTMRKYFYKSSSDSTLMALANLSAYMFWDVEFNMVRCRKKLIEFDNVTGSFDNPNHLWKWTLQEEEEHIVWCKMHDINPTSVRSISDIIESIINTVFLVRFEPDWLKCNDPTPLWRQHRSTWKGNYIISRDMIRKVYGPEDGPLLCDILSELVSNKGNPATVLPLVRDIYRSYDIDEGSSESEHKIDDDSYYYQPTRRPTTTRVPPRPMACVHFLMGNCRYGDHCRNSHDPGARRPPCKFFASGRCAQGDDCVFSHGNDDDDDETQQRQQLQRLVQPKRSGSSVAGEDDQLSPLVPLIASLTMATGPTGWFRQHHNSCMILGEGNFNFTKALISMGKRPLCATTLHERSSMAAAAAATTAAGTQNNAADDDRTFYGVDATRMHMDTRLLQWLNMGVSKFVWNFPFTGIDEDPTQNELLLLETFQSLSLTVEYYAKNRGILIFNNNNNNDDGEDGKVMTDSSFMFGVTLQGDQLSRWNVLRSAQRADGWQLIQWSDFDYRDFPGYIPSRDSGDPFPSEDERFYVFEKRLSPIEENLLRSID